MARAALSTRPMRRLRLAVLAWALLWLPLAGVAAAWHDLVAHGPAAEQPASHDAPGADAPCLVCLSAHALHHAGPPDGSGATHVPAATQAQTAAPAFRHRPAQPAAGYLSRAPPSTLH